jgi:hypothetical protein
MKQRRSGQLPRTNLPNGAYRRRFPAVVLAVLAALGLVVSASPFLPATDAEGAALGGPATGAVVAPNAPSASVETTVDGPGHHFGFTQASVLAQTTPIPSANLQFVGVVTVPGWTVANQSTDIPSWDPQRRIMYVPQRVLGSDGAEVGIDTNPGSPTYNQVIGSIPMPAGCALVMTSRGRACPSGTLVAPDLRKLLVTDRGSHVFIFDISQTPFPQTPVATITLAGGAGGADEMDYDPVNHFAFVNNGGGLFPPLPGGSVGPIQVTMINVATNALVNTVVVPTPSLEQPRFNPVDGFIYNNDSGRNLLLKQDPQTGAIVAQFPMPCPGGATGIDIDPVTNTAVLGCGAPDPTPVIDLNTGAVLQTFPHIDGADGLMFSNNTRRWYTASSNNPNTNTVDSCPQDTTSAARPIPVVGVFAAGSTASRNATLVGGQCSSSGAHSLGVDFISNQVYVPGKQFPANVPGNVGVVVFQDTTTGPSRQASTATLGANGSVNFTPVGAASSVLGTFTGLTGTGPFQLVVVTSIGNEVVSCTTTGTTATCNGLVQGVPIAGAPVILSGNGTILARGTTAAGTAPTPLTPVLTSQQAITQAQGVPGFVSGTTGRACATQVGQQCTGTGGGLTATGRVTSSMTWTVSATLPAAPAAGAGTPIFVVTTTAGAEGVPCTPAPAAAPAAGSVVTCTATTVGNALQGAAAVLVFPGVGGAAGPAVGPAIITGPGPAAAVAALLPPLLPPGPPPLPLLPPPPPPLLSPPPTMMGGTMRMPEVPVIPEADSALLLLGGFAALGGLAAWRARRRREP